MIEWGDSLSVKHDQMDNQHKVLVDYINDFYQAAQEDNYQQQIEILAKIQSFAMLHFQEEEKLLEKHEYAELKKHRFIHEQLLQRVEELATELQVNVPGVSSRVKHFLKSWLTAHIQGIDMKYSEHLAEMQG